MRSQRDFQKFLDFDLLPYSSGANKIGLPEMLISPEIIPIRQEIIDEAGQIVKAFHFLRQMPLYQKSILSEGPEIVKWKPPNSSILMSYDFHLTSSGLKLIEINTNAACSLLLHALNIFNCVEQFGESSFPERLKEEFIEEIRTFGLNGSNSITIAIIDDNLKKQKTYFDFLLSQTQIESWGWECILGEPQDFILDEESGYLISKNGNRIHLVYNRLVDFLLESPNHNHLALAYLRGKTCFSPNPHEYFLLSDKKRLVDISTPGWLESLQVPDNMIQILRRTVEKTILVDLSKANELWQNRKSLFFKLRSSHSGKQAVRGKSITKKAFEHILKNGNFVAQKFILAPKLKFPQSSQEFKFDLRFYAYKDAIDLVGARLYNGAVTNFQNLGGGFASVKIV